MFFSFRSKSLWRVVGPLIAIVLLQAVLSAGSLQVMSAVRAYVAGESLWSKGQKDAIHYLQIYVGTGTRDYLRKFDAAIAVPLADRAARQALETPGGDDAIARTAFRQAGNHDDDIGGLIWLFKYFRNMEHVAGAVTAWRNSDALLDQLIRLRIEAEGDVALHDPTATTIKRWAERIGTVDAAMSSLAVDFSEQLGRASRQVSSLLLLVNAIIAAGLAGIVLFHTRRMLWRRWLAETALEREKQRAQLTLASIGDAVIVTAPDDRVSYMNPAAQQLLTTGADTTDRPVSSLFSVVEQPVKGPFGVAEGTEEGRPIQSFLVRPDHSTVPISLVETAITHDGEPAGRVMIIHDMTAERRLVEQLAWAASHDALTGLANRRQFEFELQKLMSGPSAADAHLMLIDLDQFKVVNDTCGHQAGDHLLRDVTGLLQARVRASDTIARLGGDEFGVLLEGCTPEQASRIADGVRQAIRDYRFMWGASTLSVGASVGVVQIRVDTESVAAVMSAADIACYAAKDEGRNRIHVYEADGISNRHREMHWVARVTRAAEENRLELFFQPIVRIGSDGIADFHELTVRLRDDDGRLVPPSEFIPAAERYNVMSIIDRWVVIRAVELLKRRREAGGSLPLLAVNLSGTSLNEQSFAEFVLHTVGEPEIASALCFEITETAAVTSLSNATFFMRELKARGCKFALDDFGTGLSSFMYLKTLPVDYLKIDGQFITQIATDAVDRSMVEAISKVGRALGIATVAEWVESEAVLDELKRIGVDYAQGYHLARPMPLAQLEG